MRYTALTLFCTALLAGCADTETYWYKDLATESEIRSDLVYCKFQNGPDGVIEIAGDDWVNICMKARGYTPLEVTSLADLKIAGLSGGQ